MRDYYLAGDDAIDFSVILSEAVPFWKKYFVSETSKMKNGLNLPLISCWHTPA